MVVGLSLSNKGTSMAKKRDKRLILPQLAAPGPTVIARIRAQIARGDDLASI